MITLQRPPWYLAPVAFIAITVAGVAFLTPFYAPVAAAIQQAPTFSGAYKVTVGSQSFVVRLGKLPGQAKQSTQAVEPHTEQEQWAVDLLASLGNADPTAETVALIVAWQTGEGTAAQFNPLATTQTMPGSTPFNHNNGYPVQNFVSREDGLEATARTITNGFYPNILQGLLTNNPEQALNASEFAMWGTGLANVEAGYRAWVAQVPTNGEATTRQALVDYALSLQGIPYIRGGRSAEGGDCSGTMQHIYLQVAGIDISPTTFSQLPTLKLIELADVQPGDLWYGQFPDDQHTGMMADVNGDGQWDLIHNGADQGEMHVTYSFLTESYLGEHTIGFRRVL